MFPQLIAGPIVRYKDIAAQLEVRKHSVEKAALGIRKFILGLSKKVLLANSLGALCSTFQTSTDRSVLYYWLYAFSFALQIYFDFSGYSDMAVGLGNIFGFHFPDNFHLPVFVKKCHGILETLAHLHWGHGSVTMSISRWAATA